MLDLGDTVAFPAVWLFVLMLPPFLIAYIVVLSIFWADFIEPRLLDWLARRSGFRDRHDAEAAGASIRR